MDSPRADTGRFPRSLIERSATEALHRLASPNRPAPSGSPGTSCPRQHHEVLERRRRGPSTSYGSADEPRAAGATRKPGWSSCSSACGLGAPGSTVRPTSCSIRWRPARPCRTRCRCGTGSLAAGSAREMNPRCSRTAPGDVAPRNPGHHRHLAGLPVPMAWVRGAGSGPSIRGSRRSSSEQLVTRRLLRHRDVRSHSVWRRCEPGYARPS